MEHFRIVRVLGEHKHSHGVRQGHKRIMASVEEGGRITTRHLDVHVNWFKNHA